MPIPFERQRFFFNRVVPEGDHSVWTGAMTTRGYGRMEIGGTLVYTHRIAYCIARNLEPAQIEDVTVLRICEENRCVNPDHLIGKPRKE